MVRKQEKYKYVNYIDGVVMVCGACFERVCDCNVEKIPIDTNMVETTLQFNKNGFRTSYSCAGHYRVGEIYNTAYFKFSESLPNDMYIPKGLRVEEKRKILRIRKIKDMSYKGKISMLNDFYVCATKNKKG